MNKFIFNTHSLNWTEAMEVYAQEAIEKGLKRTITSETTYTIKASIVNKKTKLIKVELSSAGFRAQCTGKDFYAAMSAVVTKFKSLVLKHTKKRIDAKRKVKSAEEVVAALAEFERSLYESPVSKEKIFMLEPCTIDTAIEQFEQTDYSFYAYKDIENNNEVSILYKRFDGTIGVIRCK